MPPWELVFACRKDRPLAEVGRHLLGRAENQLVISDAIGATGDVPLGGGHTGIRVVVVRLQAQGIDLVFQKLAGGDGEGAVSGIVVLDTGIPDEHGVPSGAIIPDLHKETPDGSIRLGRNHKRGSGSEGSAHQEGVLLGHIQFSAV